jgi:hypothetical protein
VCREREGQNSLRGHGKNRWEAKMGSRQNGHYGKIKIKFTLEQATKAQMGSICISLLFL